MNVPRALLASLVLPAAFAATITPASAAGELVSRATGADGARIASAELVTATRDGRFVLFSASSDAANTSPYPDTTLFLRDRETDTTTPVLRADGEAGVVWTNPAIGGVWRGLDVSSDGTKVLFAGLKQDGSTGGALYVRDLEASTTKVVSLLPSGETASTIEGFARFVDGGAAVLYGAKSADGTSATYTRELVSGTAELFQAGVAPISATADGETITWSRPLLPAKRPAGTRSGAQGWATEYAGRASGYTVRGQQPVVVARTTIKESANNPGTFCYSSPVGYSSSNPDVVEISDTGRLLHQVSTRSSSNFSSEPGLSYSFRAAHEAWGILPGENNGYPRTNIEVLDLGETGLTWLTSAWPFNSGYEAALLRIRGPVNNVAIPSNGGNDSHSEGVSSARLFASDTGAILGEVKVMWADGIKTSERGVYAYDPTAPAPSVTPTTPSRADGEILDDPSLTADVTWASCPELMVGAPAQYATATYDAPLSWLKSAGTVTSGPSGDDLSIGVAPSLRPALKTTVTVKTFGFTTWSKVLPGSQLPPKRVALPKPWLFFPQSVTIDTLVAGEGDGPETHLLQKRSWQVWQ